MEQAIRSLPNDVGKVMLQRVTETDRTRVEFVLDGKPACALEGDTVLTAVLATTEQLRFTEFLGQPRAGFCMMGACQDCWIESAGQGRLRACTTFIKDGMRFLTRPITVQTLPPSATPWPPGGGE